jgi:hypothetical protein
MVLYLKKGEKRGEREGKGEGWRERERGVGERGEKGKRVVLQTVLQWGGSAVGGGNYWAIASCYYI